jgi:hypothetical protein
MRFFGDYWQNFGELIGRSAAAGGGVAAPVIATDAVIGTELDAGAGYSTYQWQSSSDGSTWADVSDATAQTYTPDDAVFGLFLRVKGDGAASNATGRVAEVPAQTLGAELLANANLTDGLTGYTTVFTGDGAITVVAPDGSAGTGALRFTASSGNVAALRQAILNIGSYYEITAVVSAYTSGTLRFGDRNGADTLLTAVGSGAKLTHSIHTECQAWVVSTSNLVLDQLSAKLVTLNAQLTAPSADGRLEFFYTPPASPIVGDQYWAVVRAEAAGGLTAGDYLLALLQYTGNQWNLTFHVVTDHARGAAIITANNVGATNGLAVVLNGDGISLESTADDGDNWTARGNATNATYNTAAGVNAAWSSAFTPDRLTYDPN